MNSLGKGISSALWLSSQPLLLLVLCVGSIVYGYLWWRSAEYEVREAGVFKKSGVFNKEQVLFLYNQVQNVEENAEFLDLLLGLKNLKISTMSAASSGNMLVGLDAGVASRLREEILARLSKPKTESVVGKKVVSSRARLGVAETASVPYKMASGPAFLAYFLIGAAMALAVMSFFVGGAIVANAGTVTANAQTALVVLIVSAVAGVVAGVSMILPYSYSVSGSQLNVTYSLFRLRTSNCRLDRIQNAVIYEPFFYRFFGIASLKIETGAQDGQREGELYSTFSIPALKSKDAHALKDLLFEKGGAAGKGVYRNLREAFPLEKAVPLKRTTKFAVYAFLLVIAAMVFAPFFLSPFPNYVNLLPYGFAAFAALILIKFVYERAYFKNFAYATTDGVLKVTKGVFGRTTAYAPYSRVQNVFVDQDIFDNAFDLVDVHLSTVGASSAAEMHVDGLNRDNAAKIKDELLSLVNKKRK